MPLSITPCVFLVDDDEDDCLLVKIVFKQYSPECNLAVFSGGEAVLSAISQTRVLPGLILLDMNMPRLDGFETLVRIRQHTRFDQLPIVMLTTSANPEDRQQALRLGANDFMTKPVTLQALNQLVLQLRQRWLVGRCVPQASSC